MGRFSFGKWKNEILDMDKQDSDSISVLSEWADYIVRENKKGKIPLIIVGAGISACEVKVQISENELKFAWSKTGLPCLQQMMTKLKELVEDAAKNSGNEELKELEKQFEIMTDDMRNINREWLGRVFTLFEKSANEEIRNIWQEFCNWFFFSCIEYNEEERKQHFGALNTKTSRTAEQIVKMYDSVDAICLSANFDNYTPLYNFLKEMPHETL